MKIVEYAGRLDRDEINSVFGRNLSGVARWSTAVDANCATAGIAVVVAHDLNVIPTEIKVEPWVDGRWWVDEDDRNAWSVRTIVFHAAAVGRYRVRAGTI